MTEATRCDASLHDLLIVSAPGLRSRSDGHEGWHHLSTNSWDIVLLDWWLPGPDGLALLRRFRASGSQVPVLFLTAHASSKDVVEAFASGADDYVVKPFRAPELGARIFGLLRRARMPSPGA